MSKILDGKLLSKQIKDELKFQVDNLIKSGKKAPHLAAIIVGNDGASLTYVSSKVKSCKKIGYNSSLIKLDEKISEQKLINEINKLNQNSDVDGFIVQLPLPKHINEEKILNQINPSKDVDGFHPSNFGKMALGLETFIPATPYGIMEIFSRYKISLEGKIVVVLGRSNIVGKPISILMSNKGNPGNATVILTHSKTNNLVNLTKQADVIVSALGIPNFLKSEMIKKNCIVIDVGITRVKNPLKPKGYEIVGDVDFDNVIKKSSYITPVPGGVGPMTIAMLLKNTMHAYIRKTS
ncbi:MAG: bifunctional 5,10-methylenetetrahydrofolate dehydrogenase/5,10-methenyltetrahydrofolate cyclohydrolase [Bacteroidota bacterium]|nr:bifunctional 5,10-methylenetetrahydrofolate dehydrogenase/5,10-methenyltetrahydrofolate cyclohydrolase [Bacteroidota bacterium]MEC7829850.1 bifunctional 5,10-methylenetetrahydrofolate dehydrogenase/5,10-methenyltetrahydrofolate cyclohydrolase [Bacteroidota bacterium]MEC8098118.1 bifunctional 5,10-methylenetetrahydrofolate dehydrogenase/5,10-methenyltetrahydrofolate cyclohydrolase [Bacteroidota bacterium]MEC8364265.1 bifunctional 5,10-methylenetetrahydrofolate dehydrogenase/5,10-methenyltetrah|tara:strand:+ start:1089 stop:1970 length:882 start_codon:yes stop_codon:yes gene_type:complete